MRLISILLCPTRRYVLIKYTVFTYSTGQLTSSLLLPTGPVWIATRMYRTMGATYAMEILDKG